MAKITIPQTGFASNGGAVMVGSDNISSQWDMLYFDKPTRPWRLVISGQQALDESADQNMTVSAFSGTIPLFSAYGTWGVQGQSSAGADKKNWKVKLKNPGTGNKLAVKIGDWFPMTTLTLKAYGTDRTLIRDSLTTEIWRNFHKSPSGFLAPQSAYEYFHNTDLGMHTSAMFSTAGFPCEVWNNGQFLGLYVLRSKNTEDDYLMDTSNPNHVLLQPQHASDFWTSGNYNANEWEYTSPAKPDDTTTAAFQRLLTWASGCIAGTVDMRKTYYDFIDLESFIDYILICETATSFDSLVNNFMIGSWNATATSGKWFLWPYDEDETFGIMAGSPSDYAPDAIQWVTNTPTRNVGGQSNAFFKAFHATFTPEIRARWKCLRDLKLIDSETINGYIQAQTDLIDPSVMAADLARWSPYAQTGIGTGDIVSDVKKKWSAGFISQYAAGRIAWLDKQWHYNG